MKMVKLVRAAIPLRGEKQNTVMVVRSVFPLQEKKIKSGQPAAPNPKILFYYPSPSKRACPILTKR
jgi:hypothetical protein